MAAGLDLSRLVGGPSKTTLFDNCEPERAVLDYINQDNIRRQIQLAISRSWEVLLIYSYIV